MRPSVRAEKYIRDASGWRKDVTDGNDNGTDGQTDGQADRQTDRQSVTQYAAPPREEGRIIIIIIIIIRFLEHPYCEKLEFTSVRPKYISFFSVEAINGSTQAILKAISWLKWNKATKDGVEKIRQLTYAVMINNW